MSICLLEGDLKMSKSHANVVSFDENVFVHLNELIRAKGTIFYERNSYWTDRKNIVIFSKGLKMFGFSVCLKALAKNDNTSATADHVKATGHNIKWDHFDILVKGKTDYHCIIKETLRVNVTNFQPGRAIAKNRKIWKTVSR